MLIQWFLINSLQTAKSVGLKPNPLMGSAQFTWIFIALPSCKAKGFLTPTIPLNITMPWAMMGSMFSSLAMPRCWLCTVEAA